MNQENLNKEGQGKPFGFFIMFVEISSMSVICFCFSRWFLVGFMWGSTVRFVLCTGFTRLRNNTGVFSMGIWCTIGFVYRLCLIGRKDVEIVKYETLRNQSVCRGPNGNMDRYRTGGQFCMWGGSLTQPHNRKEANGGQEETQNRATWTILRKWIVTWDKRSQKALWILVGSGYDWYRHHTDIRSPNIWENSGDIWFCNNGFYVYCFLRINIKEQGVLRIEYEIESRDARGIYLISDSIWKCLIHGLHHTYVEKLGRALKIFFYESTKLELQRSGK